MLEPVAFEKALDSYLESQSTEEIRALVLRSIKRLDGAHRVQLALYLGLDVAGDPIAEVAGSAVDDREMRRFIASCALLRERFGAFLRDNPRAIRALGKSTAARILGQPDNRPALLFGRVPPSIMAAAAFTLLLAFLPLAAQYERQRGMIAGQSDVIAPPVIAARPAPVRAAVKHAHAVRRVTSAPHRVIAMRPSHLHAMRARVAYVAPRRHALHHVYVASDWKFDPRYNPYFNHSRWHVLHYVAHVPHRRPVTGPHALPPGMAGRATLVVSSYLHAVIAGNTTSALHHLGLPANASLGNLSERPIVSRDTHARVTSVEGQPDGGAKVEVDINGQHGEFFEVFYVAHDGPAVRITNRYYIPVNRTAEERAARLLAKDGH